MSHRMLKYHFHVVQILGFIDNSHKRTEALQSLRDYKSLQSLQDYKLWNNYDMEWLNPACMDHEVLENKRLEDRHFASLDHILYTYEITHSNIILPNNKLIVTTWLQCIWVVIIGTSSI